MVFFEAPQRVAATLADMAAALGVDRPAALCRELSKIHEEVVRDSVAGLAGWASHGVRGEVTLVVRGAQPAAARPDREGLASSVAGLVATGADRREAIAEVARRSGVPKREVFDALVAAKADQPGADPRT